MIENGESIEKKMEERKYLKNIAKHQAIWYILLQYSIGFHEHLKFSFDKSNI